MITPPPSSHFIWVFGTNSLDFWCHVATGQTFAGTTAKAELHRHHQAAHRVTPLHIVFDVYATQNKDDFFFWLRCLHATPVSELQFHSLFKFPDVKLLFLYTNFKQNTNSKQFNYSQ